MAKKIDGQSAPHYQIHLGGDARTGEIGLGGPIVPARLADQAVALLRRGYLSDRGAGESVRAWAERIGKAGLADLLKPIDGTGADGMFVDWGDAQTFAGAPTARGECAAPFANDELLEDLADDALIAMDRMADAGRGDEALAAGRDACVFVARRLLATAGQATAADSPAAAVFAAFSGSFAGTPSAAALDAALAASGDAAAFREAVAVLIDTARAALEAPAAAAVGDMAAILGAG
jgi:sulfite reductase (NADPH) hemoprotein beta-component